VFSRKSANARSPFLSAALIVRNEEKYLEACLASIRGIVDETIVVDTGSTDSSRDLAVQFGASVSEFPWNHDFAAARNQALSLCRGRWILYIDADERVVSGSRAQLVDTLSRPRVVGGKVLLRPRSNMTPYWETRLFRNHRLIRFRGKIHETILPALEVHRWIHRGHVVKTGLALEHVGYEGDQTAKHQRNIPLLVEGLRLEPDRLYLRCHLASIYAAIGQDDLAESTWKEAVRRAHNSRRPATTDSFAYVGYMQFLLDHGRDISALLTEAVWTFPEVVHLNWYQALSAMNARDYRTAARHLQTLIDKGQAPDFDRTIGCDTHLLGSAAYSLLGACCYHLREYDQAARHYARAAEAEPENLEFRVKRHLCLTLAKTRGEDLD